MTDRGIIFSVPMVKALLQGRKTQTRRLATSPLRRCAPGDRLWVREGVAAEELSRPPKPRPATRRERQHLGRTSVIICDEDDGADGLRYLADDAWTKIENTPEAGEAWGTLFHYGCKGAARPSGLRGRSVPSIHMPRWASRLTLIVEAARIEPLKAISEGDAYAEGVELESADPPFWYVPGISTSEVCSLIEKPGSGPVDCYRRLWSSLHGAESWDANPEVVALTFRVIRGNIDQVGP